TTNDMLRTNVSVYGSIIRGVLTANQGNGYRTIGERIKISYLCYGQRSDYQAEDSALCDEYYKFYSFDTSITNSLYAFDITDSGHYVKHCAPDPSLSQGNPVRVLSGLNANREQVNTIGFSNGYEIDRFHIFHIKPR